MIGGFIGKAIGEPFGGAGQFDVTSTAVLQKPVNVVMAGHQPIKDRFRTFEIPPFRKTEKVTARGSSVRRMSGPAPSFTTTTSKRGHN